MITFMDMATCAMDRKHANTDVFARQFVYPKPMMKWNGYQPQRDARLTQPTHWLKHVAAGRPLVITDVRLVIGGPGAVRGIQL